MASREIEDLDLSFQNLARHFLDESNKLTFPWLTFITDGKRTPQEQDALYASGRTKPGPVLTNANDSNSWHVHGLAIDCAFQKDGKLSYAQIYYDKIVPIAKKLGIIWGGDFPAIDKPHFEWHPNIILAQAKQGKRPPVWTETGTIDGVVNWVSQMFQGIGIDLNKPEGEVRGKVQEVIDGWKKFVDLEQKISKLEKELSFQSGQAAEFETRLQLSEGQVNELRDALSNARDSVTSRDAEISNLTQRIAALEKIIDPTTKIVISKEEYARLSDPEPLKRFSAGRLLIEAIKKLGSR